MHLLGGCRRLCVTASRAGGPPSRSGGSVPSRDRQGAMIIASLTVDHKQCSTGDDITSTICAQKDEEKGGSGRASQSRKPAAAQRSRKIAAASQSSSTSNSLLGFLSRPICAPFPLSIAQPQRIGGLCAMSRPEMQAMCGFRRRAPNASAAGDSCQGQARGACDRPPPPWAARLVFLTPLASTWCFMKQHRERRKAAVHHSSPSSVETGDAMPISLYFVALRRLRDAGGRGAFYRGPRASSFTDCTADRQTTFSPHLLFLSLPSFAPLLKRRTILSYWHIHSLFCFSAVDTLDKGSALLDQPFLHSTVLHQDIVHTALH
ncbi:hypothetical protein BU26DRAFT_503948 [Trematosphaeria pertusa]|uniref:Uncharacterized protein n=1 Tax=Trematosphaeria pertusa TaxID=390896 RepID=A0A6A6IPM4_9PLEO|nr:uncharacterized protein BU26DRAFT_503948 [Trematosphaeria pertusa]KAF2251443.1 hypothetical protein BU26DRAFT_503948 [Trematosphaeria pertusa]